MSGPQNSPKVGEVLNITTKMTEEGNHFSLQSLLLCYCLTLSHTDIRDLFTALRQRIHSVDQVRGVHGPVCVYVCYNGGYICLSLASG